MRKTALWLALIAASAAPAVADTTETTAIILACTAVFTATSKWIAVPVAKVVHRKAIKPVYRKVLKPTGKAIKQAVAP